MMDDPPQPTWKDIDCEACSYGYRLAADGLHYNDEQGGRTWGVCRKVVATLDGISACNCAEKMREKPYFRAFACNRCGAQYEMQRVVIKCSHQNTYKLTETSRRCHDCGAKILFMATTNPKEERIGEIRERLASDQNAQPARDEVDLLLSLLDSQAAGDYSKLAHEILSKYNSVDNRGLLRDKVAEGFASAASNAATRMRERCVSMIREMSAEWDVDSRDPRADLKNLIGVRGRARADAALEIIKALESLTLDGKKE